jgi:hypothetical protein
MPSHVSMTVGCHWEKLPPSHTIVHIEGTIFWFLLSPILFERWKNFKFYSKWPLSCPVMIQSSWWKRQFCVNEDYVYPSPGWSPTPDHTKGIPFLEFPACGMDIIFRLDLLLGFACSVYTTIFCALPESPWKIIATSNNDIHLMATNINFSNLPPQFPQEPPLVKIAPPMQHPWISDKMIVTGCPSLNNVSSCQCQC